MPGNLCVVSVSAVPCNGTHILAIRPKETSGKGRKDHSEGSKLPWYLNLLRIRFQGCSISSAMMLSNTTNASSTNLLIRHYTIVAESGLEEGQ